MSRDLYPDYEDALRDAKEWLKRFPPPFYSVELSVALEYGLKFSHVLVAPEELEKLPDELKNDSA